MAKTACPAATGKTLMWATGASRMQYRRTGLHRSGFTLLELLAAMAIAAIVLAVAVPASVRMYDSMRYRDAVRETITLLATARYRAVTTGEAQDVEIIPRKRQLQLDDSSRTLPGNITLAVHSAKELNRNDTGVIRFYPEGGSSGGGVDLQSDRGRGVSIRVDWLMGGVTQQDYAAQ